MIFTENRDLHDNLRAHFQTLDVQHLNAVLLENGVTDLELRKNILQNYFFISGEFFDSGWFEAEGKKYSAIVCFREVGADLRRADTMVCPVQIGQPFSRNGDRYRGNGGRGSGKRECASERRIDRG